jgi:hypothetical protein
MLHEQRYLHSDTPRSTRCTQRSPGGQVASWSGSHVRRHRLPRQNWPEGHAGRPTPQGNTHSMRRETPASVDRTSVNVQREPSGQEVPEQSPPRTRAQTEMPPASRAHWKPSGHVRPSQVGTHEGPSRPCWQKKPAGQSEGVESLQGRPHQPLLQNSPGEQCTSSMPRPVAHGSPSERSPWRKSHPRRYGPLPSVGNVRQNLSGSQ